MAVGSGQFDHVVALIVAYGQRLAAGRAVEQLPAEFLETEPAGKVEQCREFFITFIIDIKIKVIIIIIIIIII